MSVQSAPTDSSLWVQASTWIRTHPGTVFAWVAALHLLIWTPLPLLVSRNLQLDLVEALALGKEWQLGYWKHPPLPWWIADALHRLIGDERIVYVLGPLSVIICMWAVWRLGLLVVRHEYALVAAIALEGTHYYNFSAVKFDQDVCQLPFWALTGWFLYRGIAEGKTLDWLLSGAFLALAFWSKYAAFVLACTIGLVLLFDATARRTWRTPGPYFMAISFAIFIAPQVWWLVSNGFRPLYYADERAVTAAYWYEFIIFPLQWAGGQLLYLAPTLLLVALLIWPPAVRRHASGDEGFPRRYVTALALGPFLLTTLIALPLGRLPVAMWGYPFWSFAPLALLMWFAPASELPPQRMRWFAMAFAAVFAMFPIAYGATEIIEPMVRDRAKATQFSGRVLAQTVTQAFRNRTHGPLVYVGGTEFFANNVAVYSADHPHVIVHADPRLSPWIDRSDMRKRGAVLVIEPGLWSDEIRDNVKRFFPTAEFQPPLWIPRQTVTSRHPVKAEWAIVPPSP